MTSAILTQASMSSSVRGRTITQGCSHGAPRARRGPPTRQRRRPGRRCVAANRVTDSSPAAHTSHRQALFSVSLSDDPSPYRRHPGV